MLIEIGLVLSSMAVGFGLGVKKRKIKSTGLENVRIAVVIEGDTIYNDLAKSHAQSELTARKAHVVLPNEVDRHATFRGTLTKDPKRRTWFILAFEVMSRDGILIGGTTVNFSSIGSISLVYAFFETIGTGRVRPNGQRNEFPEDEKIVYITKAAMRSLDSTEAWAKIRI